MRYTIDKCCAHDVAVWDDSDCYAYMYVLYHIRVVSWIGSYHMSSRMEELL